MENKIKMNVLPEVRDSAEALKEMEKVNERYKKRVYKGFQVKNEALHHTIERQAFQIEMLKHLLKKNAPRKTRKPVYEYDSSEEDATEWDRNTDWEVVKSRKRFLRTKEKKAYERSARYDARTKRVERECVERIKFYQHKVDEFLETIHVATISCELSDDLQTMTCSYEEGDAAPVTPAKRRRRLLPTEGRGDTKDEDTPLPTMIVKKEK